MSSSVEFLRFFEFFLLILLSIVEIRSAERIPVLKPDSIWTDSHSEKSSRTVLKKRF